MLNSINSLLKRKYNGYIVYLHNFSNFDGVFMMRLLAMNLDCEILKRDDRILEVKVKFRVSNENKRYYSISFRYSLLMLQSKLRDLAVSFNVETKKGIFPYSFVNNPKLKLNYIGAVPSIDFLDDISKTDYNVYCKKYDL